MEAAAGRLHKERENTQMGSTTLPTADGFTTEGSKVKKPRGERNATSVGILLKNPADSTNTIRVVATNGGKVFATEQYFEGVDAEGNPKKVTKRGATTQKDNYEGAKTFARDVADKLKATGWVPSLGEQGRKKPDAFTLDNLPKPRAVAAAGSAPAVKPAAKPAAAPAKR